MQNATSGAVAQHSEVVGVGVVRVEELEAEKLEADELEADELEAEEGRETEDTEAGDSWRRPQCAKNALTRENKSGYAVSCERTNTTRRARIYRSISADAAIGYFA